VTDVAAVASPFGFLPPGRQRVPTADVFDRRPSNAAASFILRIRANDPLCMRLGLGVALSAERDEVGARFFPAVVSRPDMMYMQAVIVDSLALVLVLGLATVRAPPPIATVHVPPYLCWYHVRIQYTDTVSI